ncbi:cell surface protein [Chitinophaga lutea]|uniref:Cell surface protein n=1 Tax=Chitinophaga lutea TaxID=2488634 RepID=A0A3N4PNJ8_9BACT|nr:PQQ-binding-like beta-propeller repeat protein [Chitinophaga lutea]RPE09178.1 cell surface protein [Chitinophaga lutea]
MRTNKFLFYAMPCIVMASMRLMGCGDGGSGDPAYGPGWPAAHADGHNSDYSPVKGARNIAFAWQRKFEGTINLGPTTGMDGQVYVTTSAEGCHLYALDARTGATRWCTDAVNQYAVASSALLDEEGRIYLADDEAMHAFDNTGRLLWETPITGFPLSAQFTQTGKVIFITHIGLLYVLDRHTGKAVIDRYSLAGGMPADSTFDPQACMRGTEACPCANTLAFDQRSGRFFFTYWKPGTPQAALWGMRYTEEGGPAVKKLWETSALPGGSASSPDISADGSRIYVNANTGGLFAMNAETGATIWEYDIGYEPGGSQSTSPDGYIMPAGGGNAPLLCIRDAGDHAALVWRNEALQNRGVATQVAGKLVYPTVAAGSERFSYDLLVVDVLTGRELDRERLPGKGLFTVGTTIGPEGNVYVPTFNGLLFAYRPD